MCASQRETVEAPLSERLVHQMNFFALYTQSLYQLLHTPVFVTWTQNRTSREKSKSNRNGGNDFQAGTPLLVPHCLSDSVHGSHHHVSMQEYLCILVHGVSSLVLLHLNIGNIQHQSVCSRQFEGSSQDLTLFQDKTLLCTKSRFLSLSSYHILVVVCQLVKSNLHPEHNPIPVTHTQ